MGQNLDTHIFEGEVDRRYTRSMIIRQIVCASAGTLALSCVWANGLIGVRLG